MSEKKTPGTSIVPISSIGAAGKELMVSPEYLANLLSRADIDQSGASAGGDIVAGNKTIHHHYAPVSGDASKIVQQLMLKLQHEIKTDQKVRDTIDNLQLFYTRKAIDGVDGLEAKLVFSGRNDEMLFALEKKELFAKLLERWSLYASAQEIFAFLLAKADHHFSSDVRPKIGTASRDEIDQLITKNIIEPLIDECGVGVFHLNHSVAMGMLYWLAEQCFVRWHA